MVVSSEVVVYTTTAVIYRPRYPHSTISRSQSLNPAKILGSDGFRVRSTFNVGDLPSSQSSATGWEPVAGGKTAQINVFVEMARRCCGKQHENVLGSFRIVAWILDSGKVIVNDHLCGRCSWDTGSGGWSGDTSLFRQFRGVDGRTIGFCFCSADEATECSLFLLNILRSDAGALHSYLKLVVRWSDRG